MLLRYLNNNAPRWIRRLVRRCLSNTAKKLWDLWREGYLPKGGYHPLAKSVRSGVVSLLYDVTFMTFPSLGLLIGVFVAESYWWLIGFVIGLAVGALLVPIASKLAHHFGWLGGYDGEAYYNDLQKTCRLLGIELEDYAEYDYLYLDRLREKAEGKLVGLARDVLATENVVDETPVLRREFSHLPGRAREKLSDAYDTFLKMGLVPEGGYGPYFKEAEERIQHTD